MSEELSLSSKLDETLAALITHEALAFDKQFHLKRSLSDEEAQEITQAAEKICLETDQLSGYGNWILGNICYELSEHGYDVENHLQHITLQRRIQAQNTFAVFRDKRYKIPYTHHRDIAKARALDIDQMHRIAQWAENNKVSQSMLRKAIAYAIGCVKADIEPDLDDETLLDNASKEKPTPPRRNYAIMPNGVVAIVYDGTREDIRKEALVVFQGSVSKWIKGDIRFPGESDDGRDEPTEGTVVPFTEPSVRDSGEHAPAGRGEVETEDGGEGLPE